MRHPSLHPVGSLVLILSVAACGDEAPADSLVQPALQVTRAAGGPATEVSCGDVISESIALGNDLIDCPGTALAVGASGIVIDGRGHLIDGQGSGSGIHVEQHGELTVKNIRVTEFEEGIHVSNATRVRIVRSQLESNELGIHLLGLAEHHEILHNEVRGGVVPIRIRGAQHTSVTGNHVSGSRLAYGITLFFAHENQLIGNTVEDGGIRLSHSRANTIERNRTAGGAQHGYSLSGGSDSNVLRRNHASGMAQAGFLVGSFVGVDPTGNVLSGNRASENGWDGFTVLDETVENELTRNSADGNALYGIRDQNLESTGETTNIYDRNRCRDNVEGPSLPEGLCR